MEKVHKANCHLRFLNDCEKYYVGDSDIKLGHPLQHWGITVGNIRANNLRISLLAGCEGLDKDAALFLLQEQSALPHRS